MERVSQTTAVPVRPAGSFRTLLILGGVTVLGHAVELAAALMVSDTFGRLAYLASLSVSAAAVAGAAAMMARARGMLVGTLAGFAVLAVDLIGYVLIAQIPSPVGLWPPGFWDQQVLAKMIFGVPASLLVALAGSLYVHRTVIAVVPVLAVVFLAAAAATAAFLGLGPNYATLPSSGGSGWDVLRAGVVCPTAIGFRITPYQIVGSNDPKSQALDSLQRGWESQGLFDFVRRPDPRGTSLSAVASSFDADAVFAYPLPSRGYELGNTCPSWTDAEVASWKARYRLVYLIDRPWKL
jgi:hypothetical protein